jgi:hypothetical protein
MISRYSPALRSAIWLLCFGAAACQATPGATAAVDGGPAIVGGETTKVDAGNGDATAAADVTAKAGIVGDICVGDAQCGSGICSSGTCVKSCAALSDCGAGEDCTSDNGVRTFCRLAIYPEGAGAPCGAGTCGDGLKCLPSIESGKAACSAQCEGDVDCPVHESCADLGTKGFWCRPRSFCAPCVLNEQCGSGGLCVKMDGNSDVRFCSYTCTPPQGTSSTSLSGECPPYAACQPVDAEGNYACIHKAGTCIGAGELCDPCSPQADNCVGARLTNPGTGESFCSEACDAKGGCATTAYACQKVGGLTESQCIPKKGQCVTKLGAILKPKTSKYPGDMLPDFPMVGYFDENENFDLLDDKLQLLHLSDFASTGKYGDRGYTKILFTVSAGWCKYCQEETAQFRAMLKAGKTKGVLIYQVLYDGMAAPSPPTLKFLVNNWIKPLKAQGAVGVDPDKDSVKWIGDGPPLNVLIDADTRRIIVKINGSPSQGMAAWLAEYL